MCARCDEWTSTPGVPSDCCRVTEASAAHGRCPGGGGREGAAAGCTAGALPRGVQALGGAPHLPALLEQAPAFIATVRGPQHVFAYANALYQQLVGFRPLVGRPVREALPELAGQGYYELLDEVLSTGRPFHAQARRILLQSAPGALPEERFVDFVYEALVESDGSRSGVCVLGLDVTERVRGEEALRRSEARFRTVMERVADMVAILDAQGAVRYARPSGGAGLGFLPGALLGHGALELVHPDDAPRAHDALARLLRMGHGAREAVELRVRDAAGGWRNLEVLAHNLLGAPEVEGVVLFGRDVSAQRQVEAQLRQAQKLVTVGRLAGGVAHDFNNLLTVIRVHADALASSLSGEQQEDSQEVVRAALRGADLARQLLVFSRQQAADPDVLAPGDVVAELRKMLRRVMSEDVQLEVRLAPDAGHVRMDRGQLEQVLMNLVVNACDAMPQGGTLTLETAPRALGPAEVPAGCRPGAYVALTVQDTGCGIASEHLGRVFEPFFTTKEPDRGTGLGLATVQGIVTGAGGFVTVHSKEGQGATFTVLLPADASAAATRPEDARAGVSPLPVLQGSETVLLVEDSEALRYATARQLRRNGYRVLEACDGDEALSVLSRPNTRVDVVLSDVVMPLVGGADLLRTLQAHAAPPALVLMTGYSQDELARRGLVHGGVPLVRKPFTTEALLQAVRAALARAAPAPACVSGGPAPGRAAS